MPAFSVSETVSIQEKLEDVYSFLREFKNWPDWSPWLICDPDCKVSFGNHSYSWEGPFVGKGTMEILKETPYEEIEFTLVFQKPWKSKAQVRMSFRKVENTTELTWEMDSSVPFYLFWMKSMMSTLVGMDYQRGLKMLKEVLETDRLLSTLDFLGEQEIQGCDYVGIERHCAISAMESAMEEDFKKVMYWAKGAGSDQLADAARKPFTLYEKWDLKQGLVYYRVCHPVKGASVEAPEGFVKGERPSCRAYVVGHTGAYRHLGNAWSAAMLRARQLKQSKELKPFEKYVSMPGDVGEKSTVTLICLPLR